MAPDTFIQFGCWNNLNGVFCLKSVMTKLSKHLSENTNTRFIAISGDNYYQYKVKDKTKKEEGGVNIINTELLKKGFDLLPNDIPINMIMGNHDLVTTTASKNYYVNTTDTVDDRCTILRNQMSLVSSKPNISYKLFQFQMIGNTLIIMFDTSMYELINTVNDSYLTCYRAYFEIHGFPEDIDPEHFSVEGLLSHQKKNILAIIREKLSLFQHMVLIGHHPIIQIKNKKDQNKCVSDINDNIQSLLRSIFEATHLDKYYYLCSDLHLYQKGNIQITFDDTHETMNIQQYIVGTGGTELDPLPISPTPCSISNTHYQIIEQNHTCGFLECTIEEEGEPSFNFIVAESEATAESESESTTDISKGGKRYTRKKTRKPRNPRKKTRKPRNPRKKTRKPRNPRKKTRTRK
jgi:hypothetical protein